MAEVRQLLEQHIQAFNTREPASEPFSADAEMVAPGATVSGREGILAFLAVFQEAFPDGQLAVGQLLVDGAAAAIEGSFTGTHGGVLHTPDGDVPPTGRTVTFRWSAVYQVAGDEIMSEHLYFDQLDFLGQLGMLPT